jgi:hypothetical protein
MCEIDELAAALYKHKLRFSVLLIGLPDYQS